VAHNHLRERVTHVLFQTLARGARIGKHDVGQALEIAWDGPRIAPERINDLAARMHAADGAEPTKYAVHVGPIPAEWTK
jgi:hypothetical protein